MITYNGTLFEGKRPNFHEKSYIAAGANVVGDVTAGEYASIWHNCAVRGDVNKITIGRYTNIQDNSVIHVSDYHETALGDFVTVGHGAMLHACTVGDHCLIGMGAIVLDGSVIGRGSVVAAGAVVAPRTVIPPFSFVAGVPGKIVKQRPEGEVSTIHAQAVKYKTLWCERYGLLPDNDGEKYHGEAIISAPQGK